MLQVQASGPRGKCSSASAIVRIGSTGDEYCSMYKTHVPTMLHCSELVTVSYVYLGYFRDCIRWICYYTTAVEAHVPCMH